MKPNLNSKSNNGVVIGAMGVIVIICIIVYILYVKYQFSFLFNEYSFK